jgi:hypothetical protein
MTFERRQSLLSHGSEMSVTSWQSFTAKYTEKFCLVGKPELKTPTAKHGSRWEENIKKGLQMREGANWINLAHDRSGLLVGSCNTLSDSVTSREFLTNLGTSRRTLLQ